MSKLIVKDVLLEHLRWRGSGTFVLSGMVNKVNEIILISDDKVIQFSYTALVVGLITTLLFDGKLPSRLYATCRVNSSHIERTSQNSLHTLMLLTMWQVDALNVIVEICNTYISTLNSSAKQVTSNPGSQDSSEVAAAFVGLEVVLRLFQALVASRPLMDSGQTSMLLTRDKPKSHPEYFEPHDFLVRLRHLFFPVLFVVWDAVWLDQAPLGVIKTVVADFLEVMGADHEDSSANSATESLGFPGIVAGGIRRTAPVSPDSARVQQLCDMGFPRTSVERALIRAHNNINAATEYLLSHPIPLMAAAAAERSAPVSVDQQPEDGSQNGGDNQDAADAPEDADPPDSSGADISMGGDGDADSAGTPSSSGQEVEPSVPPPHESDHASELQLLREAAAPGVASKALSIIDRHPDLVFDVKRAFIGPVDKHQAQAARELLTNPKSFCPEDVADTSLAARLRLIALVLGESRSSGFILGSNEIDLLSQCLVKKFQALDKTDTTPSPTWLAPLLLVMENLLILGDEIQPIELPKPEEAVPSAQLRVVTSNIEARNILFDFCLHLLSASNPDKNGLISCLRLLVLLTREHRLAVEFFAGGLSKLLDRFRNPTDDTRGCQVHAIILLRHIIEDRTILETIIKQDLIRWFTHPRTRTHDVWSFIRNNSHLALRDMTVFVEMCRSICTLSSASLAGPTFQISLKEGKKPKPSEHSTFDPPVVPMTGDPQPPENLVEEGTVAPQSEPLDTLLRLLVSEVLRVGRATVMASIQLDSSASDSLAVQSNNEKSTKVDTEMSEFVYTCFLLQCLTELLSSYNACKGAFVSYSRKRSTLAKDASKQKSTILHFLLSDLLFFADAETSSIDIDKRRVVLSNCAIATVVALCTDPSLATTIKDIPPEVVAARRLVLDAVAKGFKETPLGESLEARYSRLGALAELTSKLLNHRPGSALTTKSLGESALHISKLMLEKNFVVLLTATLGEIDLNYPNVRGLVAAMLRPLEYLYVLISIGPYIPLMQDLFISTKTAIKMGRTTEKSKLPSSLLEPDESASSDFSVDEDDGEAGSDREETPDLYRNSALGM